MSEAHLLSLFNTGRLVEVKIPDEEGNDQVFEIWMRRPTAGQKEEARTKAQAKMARFRQKARSEGSDEQLSLVLEVASDSTDELVGQLLAFASQNLREQARNEVLHSDEVGSDWSGEGLDYSSILLAASQRTEEIIKHNRELEEGQDALRLLPESDEELKTLRDTLGVFDREVEDRLGVLLDEEEHELRSLSDDELRSRLLKEVEDLEARMKWYEEYRLRMLHYACRFPDDRKKLYFAEATDILELPLRIQQELFMSLDAMEIDSKN